MGHARPARNHEFTYHLTRSMYLLEAASTLGFFLMLSAGFLYVAGNLQYFANATLLLIINIMRFLGFMAVGVNFIALGLIVWWGIHTRHLPWWRILFSAGCLVIGLLLSAGAVFVDVLSRATTGA